jgi:ABC-type polar amino acid transport system ATPase subunit
MQSTAVTIRGLSVSRGTTPVLRGVDLDVGMGEICALMGVSGAGKSTVLRAIAALQAFHAGSIDVDGFALHPGPVPPESKLRPLRKKVGFVFQAHSLFEHLSVIDNVTLAPIHAQGWARDKARDIASSLLETLGVAARASAFPRQLSGGEAQRAAIARALALDPHLLLMDEPTSALDPARRNALGETLTTLATQGRGLLIATHDVDFAHDFANRVVVLADGVMVEQGAAKEVLASPGHPATRALLES